MQTQPGYARPRPYVGVSGVTTPAQRAWLTGWAHALHLGEHRDLLLGVKATHKTQYLGVENKYGKDWYPVGDAFADALTPEPSIDPALGPPNVLGVAQVYFDVEHVNDPGYRREFIDRIVERGAGWLTGLQFDLLPWHVAPWTADFLDGLRDRHELQIYLQCHDPAMHGLGPAAVADRLASLSTGLDYVLFDASHGTGKRLDVRALDRFLEAAHTHRGLAGVGFGVAGGLSAAAVTDDLPALLTRYPDLSFDAEGALHPARTDGSRPLDLAVAADYLRAAAAVTTDLRGAA